MNSGSQGSGQSGMSKFAKAALATLGVAGATVATVYGVKKVKQWQAERQAAAEQPSEETPSSPAVVPHTTEAPYAASIEQAPVVSIDGEQLAFNDAQRLFSTWFAGEVKAKRMLVVDGGAVGRGEGDFLIGEGTYKGSDQLYIWELRGGNWTRIATVANRNGNAKLTDLKLEGTPFAIEVGGRLYRNGGASVAGTATLAMIEA